MTDKKMTEEKKKRKPLGLQIPSTPHSQAPGQIRQSLSHGRSKSVTVEVKRRRQSGAIGPDRDSGTRLTGQEQTVRLKALQEALIVQEQQTALQAAHDLFQASQAPVDLPESQAAVDLPVEPAEQTDAFNAVGGHEEDLSGHSDGMGEHLDVGFAPVASEIPVSVPVSPALTAEEPFAENLKKRRSNKEDRPEMASKEKENYRKTEAIKKTQKAGRKKDIKVFPGDLADAEDFYRPVLGLKKLRKNSVGGSKNRSKSSTTTPSVIIRDRISIDDLAHQMGEKVTVVIRSLNKIGMTVTSQSSIDGDSAQLFAEERGCMVKRDLHENLEYSLWNQEASDAVTRPPVVTVMGHVDHGKTSLLDALRKTDVVAKESGGITQHIGAYRVHLASGKVITFIDTPGHQAFTKMRARGAEMTDIVILVVAADDGINAQTIEAIAHCKAANVPMIVAINKIDKPGARPDYVRQQLLSHDIVVEKLGGDVQDVEVSALQGIGLDHLEEAIVLQAELLGLAASQTIRAKGVILETHVKKGYGSVATLMVQEGTLRKGDLFVVGTKWGRVRLLFDDAGKTVSDATASQPVEVVGFSELPQSGDLFMVVPSESAAKEFVSWKKEHLSSMTEDNISQQLSLADHLKSQNQKEKAVVIKADAQGSLEGVLNELAKISHDEIQLKIVSTGVGAINEGDALLAITSGALIINFNVPVLPEAQKLIENKGLCVLRHKIIYRVTDDVRKILSGLLAPVYQEEWLGKAQVMQVFHVKKESAIAGCLIKEGLLRRSESVRVLRGGKVVYEGSLKTLRHVKDDVREKTAGHECGVMLDGYSDFHVDDVIECFTRKRVERSV
ncbi:MAG: translation initiation factor IF-2 [Alphaproteobacteria bacterium]|nr:translation initiation factor IF-2 [Alphaproteobacteria bacterium]